MSDLFELRGVQKWVGTADQRVDILQPLSLRIRSGEFVALMGPSGSGKSTLLNLLGLLDAPSAGELLLNGQAVSGLSDDEASRVRSRSMGFIFQAFHLLPYLTAEENVMLPMTYRYRSDARSRAGRLLEEMNLQHRLHAYPATLSGGERQRVAIARALANDPSVILADEPTGALDSRSGAQILELLAGLHRQGVSIVLVTHDPAIGRRAQRVLSMKDGQIQ